MAVLKCESVSKRYRIQQAGDEVSGSLLQKIRSRIRPAGGEFWALRDISFEIQQGESVGVIGHNGAGKSTLLKLLSNITAPTSGRITIHGKISALLEVGSGFHPELSGRENCFLSGSILGMRRAEIASKLDDIVEFAEIRQFLDVPVKRYSSGMYVRLGFAIAAHLDPDILLLDEVLAVGDASFQQKCRERIQALKRRGTTIIFISHDLAAVEEVCERVLLMRKGQIVDDGGPGNVIAAYQGNASIHDSRANHAEFGTRAHLQSVELVDEPGQPRSEFVTGGFLFGRIRYQALEALKDVNFSLSFHAPDGSMACVLTTQRMWGFVDIPKGDGYVEMTVPSLGLGPGIYNVDVAIEQKDTPGLDWLRHCMVIKVNDAGPFRGSFYNAHETRIVTSDSVLIPSATGGCDSI